MSCNSPTTTDGRIWDIFVSAPQAILRSTFLKARNTSIPGLFSAAPTNVKFVRSEKMAKRGLDIEMRNDGIALLRGTTIIFR